MSCLTAGLLTSWLQGGAAVNEFLLSKMEEGANAVLQVELAGFLGCEKHHSVGWHTGNSRNGFYQRTIVTSYGKITTDVPRERSSEFQSPWLPARNISLRTTTRNFITGQSARSNSPMRIRRNGSPAWSAAIAADGSLEKLIADFRKSIRNGWRCSWIDSFGLHYKKFTQSSGLHCGQLWQQFQCYNLWHLIQRLNPSAFFWLSTFSSIRPKSRSISL